MINLSAAIYAYKFTHFIKDQQPPYTPHNILVKTWKLFTGPSFYNLPEDQKPGFSYDHVTLETADHVPIDGWYSASDSSKTCVILLHALSTNKSFLINEALEFKNWGYAVLMIDFRGHGKSGGQSSTFGVKETNEVESAVAYAKARGNKKIILYGFSMGSVAIMKAIAEKKIVPAAVILEAPFNKLHELIRSRATTLGFPGEPFGTLVTFWTGVEHGYNGFKHNGSDYAKSITCPVLLGWGENDRYIDRSQIAAIFNHIPSLQKKLVIYPDADHEDYLKVDPIMWEREVGTFLRQQK